MKSPMIESADYINDKVGYSDLQVLESPAGFYVGTMFNDPEDGQVPGSRDSGYFPSRDLAEEFLKSIEGGEALEMLRMMP